MNDFLKSIGAVLSGTLAGIILSLGTDFLLEALGVFPDFQEQMAHGLFVTWLLVLSTIYRTLYTGVAGYVTALLAPSQPLRHVVMLGLVVLVVNVVRLVVSLGKGLSPAWYPIVLSVLAFPAALLGGKLQVFNKTN